jgi:hypothetical protein
MTRPRLIIGEVCSCSVCGAQSGPSLKDVFIFSTEIHPGYDQEIIDKQFSLLERLLDEGFQMEEALKVVATIHSCGAGDDDLNG